MQEQAPSLENTTTEDQFIPSPIGARIGASILDGLLLLTFFYAVCVMGVYGLMKNTPPELLTQESFLNSPKVIGFVTGITLFSLLLFHGYFIFSEYRFGKTLGKRLFRLKVISTRSSKLELKQCVWREVFRYIDGLFLFLPGLAVIVFSKRRQRLGDLYAKTRVIQEPLAEARFDESSEP